MEELIQTKGYILSYFFHSITYEHIHITVHVIILLFVKELSMVMSLYGPNVKTFL